MRTKTQTPRKHKWFDTGRIGALSDGIFAIAMTLLVLEVKFPKLEGTVSSEFFYDAILGQLPHFTAWLISFALLCLLWIIHHGLLHGEEKLPRRIAGMNFVLLGVVSFIPFPTSLISQHPEQPLSVIIFSATYAAAGLALAGMQLMRGKQQCTSGASDMAYRAARWMILYLPVTAIIACALTLVDTRLSLVVWIAFIFIFGFHRRYMLRHNQDTQEP